jgi:hypothetical protein
MQSVKIKVILRHTVIRLVRLSIRNPSGTWDQMFPFFKFIFRQLWICWCGAPSLTRGPVFSFESLLDLDSAVFLGSESDEIHDHILLSLLLRLPQPGRKVSCIYFPQKQDSPSNLCNAFISYLKIKFVPHRKHADSLFWKDNTLLK